MEEVSHSTDSHCHSQMSQYRKLQVRQFSTTWLSFDEWSTDLMLLLEMGQKYSDWYLYE